MGSADEGQCPVKCGVTPGNGNSGDRVAPAHISIYYHFTVTDAGFNCCVAVLMACDSFAHRLGGRGQSSAIALFRIPFDVIQTPFTSPQLL